MARPLLVLSLLALAACGGGEDGGNSAGAGGGAGKAGPGGQRGPKPVGFVVARPQAVPLSVELAGRTAAFEQSEVRPQVTGILRRRLFTEGALVRAGQPLYQIDPSLYQAAANEAAANLQSAGANLEAARIRADRYRPLAEMEAVSKQEYTDARAQAGQAAASVAQTRAQLETARINLRFTQLAAPITGRIGRSLVTVGALVSATQTNPLAVIQRLDPIFVDIQQSAADLVGLRRQLTSSGVGAGSAAVKLRLEDGSDYGRTGTVEFAEALVDTATGTVTLRARMPNPDGILLPGMFVRATFVQSVEQNAFLVPQQSVTRDAKGNATVMLVGADNMAVQRGVTTAGTQGPNWIVTKGLNAGDKVITQGLGMLRPGMPIKPMPANTPQRVQAPPQQGQGAGGGGEAGAKKAN